MDEKPIWANLTGADKPAKDMPAAFSATSSCFRPTFARGLFMQNHERVKARESRVRSLDPPRFTVITKLCGAD